MPIIKIEKLDEVYVRVFSDPSVEMELVQFFTYEYPGAKFTPQYRARMWDGFVKLLDPVRKTLYLGLVPYIEQFAASNGYAVEYVNQVAHTNNITTEIITQFVKALNPPKKIEIRDYQIEAMTTAIDKERTLLLSPTASGKSFIIYSIMRWHLNAGRKCIIIVPTTSLVEQLYTDFEDYSSVNNWVVSEHCQKLYSGFTKEFTKNVIVTTWQSVYLQPKSWFAQFNVVFGDECLHPETNITLSDGRNVPIKYVKTGDLVKTLNETSGIIENKPVLKIHKNITKNEKVYKIKLKTGKELIVTGNHKIHTESGWLRVDELSGLEKLKTINS